MMRPTLTNTLPQVPTASSSTPAIDGWRSSAISAIGMMPYDTIVTEAKMAKTLRNPSTVARPTSSRRLAWREYTLAPSTPRNTNTVASIVPRTWSNSEPA